jgi:hypothetical protein
MSNGADAGLCILSTSSVSYGKKEKLSEWGSEHALVSISYHTHEKSTS